MYSSRILYFLDFRVYSTRCKELENIQGVKNERRREEEEGKFVCLC
jgi:hypothetical protein